MATSLGGSTISFNRSDAVIDYTSLDFRALKIDFTQYAQQRFSDRWTDFNEDQFAVVFLEMFCYIGDLLTFYLNAVLRENSLVTVQRRQHLVDIARGFDYELKSASQSTTPLTLTSDPALLPYVLPSTMQFAAGDVIFQPLQNETITTVSQNIDIVEGEQFLDVVLGTSDGSAEQSFTLPQTGVVLQGVDVPVIKVAGVTWSRTTSFTTVEPGSQVYKLRTNDRDVTTVHFGDGVNGKVPPTAAAVTATFKVGGGTRGNVGAGAIDTIVSALPGLLSVTNLSAPTGGGPQETLSTARDAIPASIKSGDRAVSLEDYAAVALRVPGVAKASAREGGTRIVEVVIAPTGGGIPTTALQNAVGAYVNARRMVGRLVRIVNPFYVNVEVELDLFKEKTASAIVLDRLVRDAFITTNVTDVQDGLLDFPNVGFGARDDQGEPQITQDRLYKLLREFKAKGVQTPRIALLTAKPYLKPYGFVNSEDYSLEFARDEPEEIERRCWRLQFTSGTTYNVYESYTGTSTSLTRSTMTDDRASFLGTSLPAGTTVTPNTNFPLGLIVNPAQSGATFVSLLSSSDDLLSIGNQGDQYRVEFAADPASGTVGTPYTPDKVSGSSHGITWTVNGTGFSSGDQFFIDVFPSVSDIILAADEIPLLSSVDLTINIKSAF